MNIEENSHTLKSIPANRKLVEALYAHGKITKEARAYALNLLYPDKQWGLWIARMLLAIGVVLVLAGIIQFFAFNWAKITPAMKLSSIQLGMIGCLIGAYCYSLQRVGGQVLLLFASVLVGVFMAAFGQIYQTGADAYQLFMMWSLLTFGWTLISNFAAQWLCWLLITNIFLWLWWWQAVLPTKEMNIMICTYLSILNAAVLALREYLSGAKAYAWLATQWIRVLLVIATLLIMLTPILVLILEPSKATKPIIVSAMIGLIGHGAAYYCYRYKLPDRLSLTATVLSGCVIVETMAFKILDEMLSKAEGVMFLFMTLITIGLFSYAIIHLRKIADSD